MSCNQPARPGQHNCRGCNSQTSMCFWHGVPASSIRSTFESMILASYVDVSREDKLAELHRLRALSDAAMLPPTPGFTPLDGLHQSLIDSYTAIGRYGQPAA